MRLVQYRQFPSVQPLPLISPGFRGLNTEMGSLVAESDTSWATDLREAVFDEFGTVSSRKGWTTITGTPFSGLVNNGIEYLKNDGTATLIAQTVDKIYESSDDGNTWTDITGALTWTAGRRWHFVNFYGKVVAGVRGEKLAVYSGSGTFTQLANSQVSSGVLTSAFGRIWACRDGTGAVDYSALLDETLWTTVAGGGTLDTSNVWTLGPDTVTAIRGFGATLTIFGKRHILLYVDGTGSTLGIDPDTMYCADTIEGTGNLSQEGVVSVGEGDLWFVSRIGIQSLARVIGEKNNPLVDVSRWVRSLATQLVETEIADEHLIQGIYNAKEAFVLYLFPSSDKILLFDTRVPQQDGTARAAEWRTQEHTCMINRADGTLLFGRAGATTSTFVEYGEYRDDYGVTNTKYSLVYGSPWLSGGQQGIDRIKIPKRVTFDIVGRETLTVVTRWGFDYRGLEYSYSQSNDYRTSGSEWSLGEWNEAEWSGGTRTRRGYSPLSGNGFVVKVWFSIESTDVSARVAIRKLSIMLKTGRIAS